MELKDLDLLSEKVAKALYIIKNLKSENEALQAKIRLLETENGSIADLQAKVTTLEEENAFYVEQIEDKETNIKIAAERLEGMINSLSELEIDDVEISQGDFFEEETNQAIEEAKAAEQSEEQPDESSDNSYEEAPKATVEESSSEETHVEASSEDDANPILDFIVDQQSEPNNDLPY
jgi:uncharacterized phage infection (PIP) family protein YhgE